MTSNSIKAAAISAKAAAHVSSSVDNTEDELELMGELFFHLAGTLGMLAHIYQRDCSDFLMEKVATGYVAGQKNISPEGARMKLQLNQEIWNDPSE